MKKGWIKGLLTALLSLLVIVYVGYQIFRGVGTTYVTDIAMNVPYVSTVSVPCWFVRSEQTVQSAQKGFLLYNAAEGEKVAKDGVVAQIFTSESSITVRESLNAVRAQIQNLESLNAQALTGTKLSVITDRISAQMGLMMNRLSQGSLSEVSQERDRLLTYFSQRQIVTGELTDFSNEVAALKQQEAQLLNAYQAPVGVVNAPVSGYFSSETDGFEQVLTVDSLADCTADSLRALTAAALPDGTVGKVVKSNVWYAACILPAEQARSFAGGDTLSLLLPGTGERASVSVSRVNASGVSGDAVVVFQGTEMSSALASVRSGSAQLELKRYTGLRIDRNAVHMELLDRTTTDADGNKTTEKVQVQGVYVIYGEQLRFREISPLYWGDTFVICDPNAAATASAPMLKQYDQVVTEGKDLYDGKAIN